MRSPVVGVASWKNSGKTTLVEKLVAELTRRGYRIATVKHAHHEADIDQPGSDSFRHRIAGATEVALVTSVRWALVHELRDEGEPTLNDILARLSPADLIIVEGYKREPIPKIEVRRMEAGRSNPLAATDSMIIAVATDHPSDASGLPNFNLSDIGGIADFLASHFGLEPGSTRPAE